MTFKQVALALATILLLSAGQVLFKLAANRVAGDVGLLGLSREPCFFVALVVYGVATLAWMLVLKEVPLTVAYPFVALAFVCVPLMGNAFLGESLRWTTFAGASLILAGVWLSVR